MKNNITIKNLSSIGFSNYDLYADGRLFKAASKLCKIDKCNRYYLTADNGNNIRITLKELYRKVYNKEFCFDTI